ncbi:MAG: amidase [Candidatus Eisenbacteria bacterium]|uniref:Amidase n=1 Tax=Eiseniibacteriota bacterium TaxID=2212470 RepID=A0A538ST31_UNCEI|nr:MAG: amidase [Candidatus Eisenbacteria bacterium]
MLSEDVFYLSVSELGVRIRSRRLSPVELTEGYLDRIHRYGAKLNAFATVTPEVALQQARAAESEIHSGHYRGPLHGIPYGAKDLLATAGIRTGWGAHPTQDQVPDKDATVVRKLREAGAVLLGKLAMVEFAGCLGYRFADASTSGPGRNPWDPERWTGGSSSGSGAAVASGLVGFAIGTETWGSILCPSAFCGVTGLRPTYGRVSRAGGMVGAYTFDKIGPITRSAADCRIVLEGIAGPDPDDPSASAEPLRLDRQGVDVSRLKGALVPLDFAKTKGAEPEVKAAFDHAVTELEGLGLKLEEAKLPDFPASEMAGLIITAEALSTFENFYKSGGVWELKDPYAPYQREITRALNGADLVKAWRMRTHLQEMMADFFSRYDVIVTPNFMSVAPSIHGDLNKALPYADPAGAVGNSCGLPAIALPCGFGREHMPVGFQIMGSPFEEATLLHLGEIFQSRTRFHQERPPLFA